MTTSPNWTCALFDIDGTVVDSAEVVVDTFIDTLGAFDLHVPARTELQLHVGPPLWDSMLQLGVPADRIGAAVDHYRKLYRDRFLQPPLFPGIRALLNDLHAAGMPLATATSKQEYMARAQIEHLALDTVFDVVAGATPGPDSTKTTVILDALNRLAALGVDTSRPVLVGDRFWDVEGGLMSGVPVIGVQWGYAEGSELDGAVALVDTPEQARDLLLSGWH